MLNKYEHIASLIGRAKERETTENFARVYKLVYFLEDDIMNIHDIYTHKGVILYKSKNPNKYLIFTKHRFLEITYDTKSQIKHALGWNLKPDILIEHQNELLSGDIIPRGREIENQISSSKIEFFKLSDLQIQNITRLAELHKIMSNGKSRDALYIPEYTSLLKRLRNLLPLN